MAKKQKKNLPTNRRYWDEPTISPRMEQFEITQELIQVTVTQKFRNFKINEIIFQKETKIMQTEFTIITTDETWTIYKNQQLWATGHFTDDGGTTVIETEEILLDHASEQLALLLVESHLN